VPARRNKALVRRFLDEVYNRGNLAVADEAIAKRYISHNKLNLEVTGPAGIKKAAQLQRRAFPDIKTHFEDLIAEGDKVVVRAYDTGTHTGGPFLGLPPRGKKFKVTWINIFRVEEDKLAEAWVEVDVEDWRRQLAGK